MKSVELFSGAGGLAMGITQAGFKHEAVVEWNHDACETVRENQRRKVKIVSSWPLFEMDVSKFDYSNISPGIDLLAGGPPCQPFSMGGKHKGHQDERNMFPEVFRAVRELQPKAILIENVKGLARASFSEYLEYIKLELSMPLLKRGNAEEWSEHLARLRKANAKNTKFELKYDVQVRLLNSADYGVPQKRERVIFIGFRSDLGVKWTYPKPTHSLEALLYDQWVTGEYWRRHKVANKDRPLMPVRYLSKIAALKASGKAPLEKPWVTVRDALAGLPCPENKKLKNEFENHSFNPGARSYPGHTGSPLDEPAKTLKAGDHGVPGGENMLLRPDGSVRYFTIRESARLQTFPDEYRFAGAWGEAMRQLGNAVPAKLAEVLAKKIASELKKCSSAKSTRSNSVDQIPVQLEFMDKTVI